MRVLLTTYPEKTFLFHLVPLAWALRTAGHEVRVACRPGFVDDVTATGLTAVPVGHDRDFWRITSSRPDRLAEMRVGIMSPYDAFTDPARATWEYLAPGMAEAVWGWHRSSNFPLVAGLVELARDWQPDLVVWEPMSFAGAIAAKACGAASARILWSVDVFGGVRRQYLDLMAQQPASQRADPFADWFAGYGRRYGFAFSEEMVTGHFTLDHVPPQLQVEAPGLDYLRMRYVAFGGPAVVPEWLTAPPRRPRVAVTMGLSATEIFDGYHVDLGELLGALAGLDVEVVATVPDVRAAALGRIPDNTRLVPRVPLLALAPTCAAAVHHAGLGTLATFAAHGVPQLAIPYHFDEPIFAGRLAGQGAGLSLDPGAATAGTVRDGVRRLLHEDAFRDGAARLRQEIDALPDPRRIVPQLEALVEKHRTR